MGFILPNIVSNQSPLMPGIISVALFCPFPLSAQLYLKEDDFASISLANKKPGNRNVVSREAAMLSIFISCWYLEASAEPESCCDELHSLVVHDSPC